MGKTDPIEPTGTLCHQLSEGSQADDRHRMPLIGNEQHLAQTGGGFNDLSY